MQAAIDGLAEWLPLPEASSDPQYLPNYLVLLPPPPVFGDSEQFGSLVWTIHPAARNIKRVSIHIHNSEVQAYET
jgi:hypothetical protein